MFNNTVFRKSVIKKCSAAATLIMGLALYTSSSQALIITHHLMDHPDGNQAPPTYGLRLDGLFSGDADDVYTFSFLDVEMTIDTGDASDNTDGYVEIAGTMLGGTSGDGKARDTEWDLFFRYDTNILIEEDGSWIVDGSSSGANFGYIALGADDIGLADFMGGQFQPDSHRCSGHSDCGPWVGIGWLSHQTTFDSATYTHYDANDFIYTVSEPAGIFLLGIGLIGLALARRQSVSL